MAASERRDWARQETDRAAAGLRFAQLDVVRRHASSALSALEQDLTPAGVDVYVAAARVKANALRDSDDNYDAWLVAEGARDRASSVLDWGVTRIHAEATALHCEFANYEQDRETGNSLRRAHRDAMALAASAEGLSPQAALDAYLLAAAIGRRTREADLCEMPLAKAAPLVLRTSDMDVTRRFYFVKAIYELEWGDPAEADELLYLASLSSANHAGRLIYQSFGRPSLELRHGDRDEGLSLLLQACNSARRAGYRRAARVALTDLSRFM